jgi:hypothetical protein
MEDLYIWKWLSSKFDGIENNKVDIKEVEKLI